MTARAGLKRNERPYCIRIEDVPPQGLELDEPLSVEFFGEFLPNKQHLHATRVGQARVRVEHQGRDDVRVRGKVEAHLSMECAACCKPFALPTEHPLDLVLFKTNGPLAPSADGELEGFEDEGAASDFRPRATR